MSNNYRLPKQLRFNQDEAERLSKVAEQTDVDISAFAKKAVIEKINRELDIKTTSETNEEFDIETTSEIINEPIDGAVQDKEWVDEGTVIVTVKKDDDLFKETYEFVEAVAVEE